MITTLALDAIGWHPVFAAAFEGCAPSSSITSLILRPLTPPAALTRSI